MIYCNVMQEQKGIITSVILLRAIAALGVCFVHLKMLTDFKTSAFLNYIFVNGQQGVTIFFVISGFILPYSLYKKQYQIKDFFNFILKRSVRVDPPYWCCILLLFILTPLPFSDFNFRGILFHITYLVPFIKSAHWYSDIFWTLSIEFQFYILLGLLYPVFMKLPYYVSILIIVLVSALCLKFTYRGIIIANLYQFAFGYIAFMAYTNMIDRKKFIIVFVLFTAYIVYAKSIISGIIPGCTV
ncbi:MAG: acyltransferase, partial [Flavobacterium sp.]